MSNAEKRTAEIVLRAAVQPRRYIISKGFSSPYGNFVDMKGKVLGQHRGIVNYTVGQRKGLGIVLGKPAFIVKIDKEKNDIILGDNEDLFTKKVLCKNAVFAAENGDDYHNAEVLAKVRYSRKLPRQF
ncbi:MAG: tRNA methyl transferase PRC-barrel domain-containing protein [Anaerovoracaceae bacterium]